MEEIIFKVGVNTGNSVRDLGQVEKEISDVNKELRNTQKTATDMNKSVDRSTADVAKRFEDLREKVASGTLTMRESAKAVKEYQTIALQAGRESPIGQQAIQEAAQLQDRLADLRNEITRASHDGANMQAALQLGTTVTAGYGAAQGAMALMGAENENLQKTLVKMQAVQAVLTGIEQIRANLEKESFMMQKAKIVSTKVMTAVEVVYAAAVGGTTGAMKALRIAMLALPIVAIIAGITALVGAIAWLVSSSEEAEEVNNALNASYDRQSEALERSNAANTREAENRLKLAKARGASAQEIHDLEMKLLKEQEIQRRKTLKLETNQLAQKKQAYKLALDEGNYELAKSIREEIEQHRKKYKDLKALDGQYQVDATAKETEFQRGQREKKEADDEKAAQDQARRAKEAADKRRQAQEEEARKALELQRTLEDLYIANIEDTGAREIAQLALNQQRRRDELVKQHGENTELLKQLDLQQANERQALLDKQEEDKKKKDAEEVKKAQDLANTDAKARLEAELINMRDDFDTRMELERELALLELEQALQNKELTDGEKLKLEAEYQEKLKGIKDQEVENEKVRTEAIRASRMELLGAVSSAIGAMAGLAREGSKTQKALALTELAINTGIGFANGLRIAQQSAAATGPGAAFAFPIFYAQQIAAVLGAAKQARSIMKAGGGGDVQPPSIAAPAQAPQAPQPNGGTSTLTAGLSGSGQGMKVYVVEHDITQQQQQSSKVDALATYGG
jgi:hypothetical protein